VTVIAAAAWQPAVFGQSFCQKRAGVPASAVKNAGLPGTLPFRLLSLTGSESP